MEEIQEGRKKDWRLFHKPWVSTPSRIKWTFVPESLPVRDGDKETKTRGQDEQGKSG